MSPTARTLKLLRDEGYLCQVVEHWNAFARRRVDLFGVIDVVAMRAGEVGLLGVQCTSAANAASRLTKARETPALGVWLSCANRFEVHSWGKRGGRGERKLWTCERRTLDEIA